MKGLQKLEQATKILEKIKVLDKDIIEIDKMAALIADGQASVSFDMAVTVKDRIKRDDVFDEHGFIKKEFQGNDEPTIEISTSPLHNHLYPGMMQIMMDTSSMNKHVVNPKEKHLKHNINDVAALQILGVLLSVKQTERNELLGKLKSLGLI